MTGGDRLKGRYMRRDFIEFMPEFKLWLASNHLPQTSRHRRGIWRRIRLIPFLETITRR
jgi:putative DNA primase/helicase